MKAKNLKELSKDQLNKKLKELRFELIKSHGSSSKTSTNTKEIKKTIARILTLNKSQKDKLKK